MQYTHKDETIDAEGNPREYTAISVPEIPGTWDIYLEYAELTAENKDARYIGEVKERTPYVAWYHGVRFEAYSCNGAVAALMNHRLLGSPGSW